MILSLSHKKGFTLVELIVYIAVLSLCLSAILPGMYSLIRQSDHASQLILAQTDTIFIKEKISYELSHAQSISLPQQATTSVLEYVWQDGSERKLYVGQGFLVLSVNGQTFMLNSSSSKLKDSSFDFSNFTLSSQISVLLVANNNTSFTFSIALTT